jgi:hypothetical protein
MVYALPFLSVLLLLGLSVKSPLSLAEGTTVGVYLVYLLPYVVISYYEAYGYLLFSVKVLLVLWATDRLLASRRLANLFTIKHAA